MNVSTVPKKRFYCQRSEQGVAAIELAIVLPVLMLILFGIINFGTVFYNYIIITNAAREGSRWGSIHADRTGPAAVCSTTAVAPPGTAAADPCQVANGYTKDLLINYGAASPTLTTTTLDSSTGNPVINVAVTYNFEGISLFKMMFQDGLKASSSMYMEPE